MIKLQIDRHELAEQLTKWRIRQDLLQREVAEMWGVSRYTIIRAESGSELVSIATLYKIANLLNKALVAESGNL